jgi:hypothetical protein
MAERKNGDFEDRDAVKDVLVAGFGRSDECSDELGKLQ